MPLENRHTKRVSVEYHQDQADSRWRQQQRQPGCPGPGHRHQLCKIDHTLNSPLNHFGLFENSSHLYLHERGFLFNEKFRCPWWWQSKEHVLSGKDSQRNISYIRVRHKALLQYCKMYGFITTYTGLKTYPYTQSLKYVLFL